MEKERQSETEREWPSYNDGSFQEISDDASNHFGQQEAEPR